MINSTSNPAWKGAGFQTLGSEADNVFARDGQVGQQGDVQIVSAEPRLTMEDVIMTTGAVFLIAAVAAGFGWFLIPDLPAASILVSMLMAAGLAFYLSFRHRISPAGVIAFAVVEGFALGAVSRYYEALYDGIVAQALLGTAVIFAVMLGLHRSGKLRATPRMYKVVGTTIAAVFVLSMLDIVLGMTGAGRVPIMNDATPLGILFSVVVLIAASLLFTLEFDQIEKAIAVGAPRREAWRAGFGLLFAFAWVYLELLRLLSKLRE